jgi:hypothetical protein
MKQSAAHNLLTNRNSRAWPDDCFYARRLALGR